LIRISSYSHKDRLNFLFYFLVVLFSIILLRAFSLQVIHRQFYKKLAEKNIIKIVFISQNRGEITDRKGNLLADNIPDYIVEIYPYLLKEEEKTLRLLSKISFISIEKIREKIKNAKSSFLPVIIKRHLTESEVAKILENITELPGVTVERKLVRNYRYGRTTSHIIGYTGETTETEIKENPELRENDVIGKSGLEKFYDLYMRGKPGIEYIEVDAARREVGIFKEMKSVEPEPGNGIRLTIDINLQKMVDSLFTEYKVGSVVAIEPQSGEVLILYSKPGFDPNRLVKGVSNEDLKDMLFVEGSSFWNRAIMSIYPPGSIFKIVIAAIALENDIVKPDSRMKSCRGFLYIGNRIFNCWKRHGSLNTYEAIVQSCDVFFYQLGIKVGYSLIKEGVGGLSIFEKTGIDLPGEKKGFFPEKEWYKKRLNISYPTKGMVANLSIGQGEVLMTPLEICSFFSSIANYGYKITPHLVKEIKDISGNILYKPEKTSKKMPLSDETITFLRKAMLGVVNERGGTGAMARINGIEVAGKTGTAENPHGEDHAWFVGFAPYKNPEICVVVMFENRGHGGAVAAPVAREIIKKALGINKTYPSKTQ